MPIANIMYRAREETEIVPKGVTFLTHPVYDMHVSHGPPDRGIITT